jgi:hypothetical protein
VGVGEPGEDPLERAGDLRERQAVAHVGAEGAALDVLHRDVRRPLELEEVVNGDDVRVVEAPGEPRLAHEALRDGEVGDAAQVQLLERDETVEVGLPREIDRRHSAATDLAQNLVSSDAAED